MSKIITAKVNAVYPNSVYLNIGGAESVIANPSNFKSLPFQGEVVELSEYEIIELKGRNNKRLVFANCKYLDRVEKAEQQEVEEFDTEFED